MSLTKGYYVVVWLTLLVLAARNQTNVSEEWQGIRRFQADGGTQPNHANKRLTNAFFLSWNLEKQNAFLSERIRNELLQAL
jgi:hypothetical protein